MASRPLQVNKRPHPDILEKSASSTDFQSEPKSCKRLFALRKSFSSICSTSNSNTTKDAFHSSKRDLDVSTLLGSSSGSSSSASSCESSSALSLLNLSATLVGLPSEPLTSLLSSSSNKSESLSDISDDEDLSHEVAYSLDPMQVRSSLTCVDRVRSLNDITRFRECNRDQLIHHLYECNSQLRKVNEQVIVLNQHMEAIQVRYERATHDNKRAFRYSLRLRMAVFEGMRNMFYEYANAKMVEINAVRCVIVERSQVNRASRDP